MPTPFARTTRSLTQDTSNPAVLAWAIGGLILSAWLFWFCFAKITRYEMSNTARLAVNRSPHPITTLVDSKVLAGSIALGQQVQTGEVLIELDASREKLLLQEEQAKLQALPQQIALLEKQMAELAQAKQKDQQASLAAINSAKAKQQEANAAVAFATENARRLKLASDGVPQMELLRARTDIQKLSAAKAALSADIQRIIMETDTHAHQKQAEIDSLKREAAQLKAELNTAQIKIARYQQAIERHVIRAPASGQIGAVIPLQIGTYVAEGDTLGTIVPPSQLKIVADFQPAAVLGRIKVGQAARLRLDGFPWVQFGVINATVSQVGSDTQDNAVRVEFMPTLAENRRIPLQHGLPGTIEVGVEQLSPAAIVLRAAGQWLTNRQPPALAHAAYPDATP